MKRILLVLICLSLFAADTYPQRRGGRGQLEDKNTGSGINESELRSSFEEFVRLSKEYQKSLEQLIVLYNRDVERAEERLARVRELYSQGQVGKEAVDESERAVSDGRAKIEEARKQIRIAEAQVDEAYRSINSTLSVNDRRQRLKTVREVAATQAGFIDRPFVINGIIKQSSYYKYGYRDAQVTHYGFEVTDGTARAYVYMPRGIYASALKKILSDSGGRARGSFTLKILPYRFDRSATELVAELLEFQPPLEK